MEDLLENRAREVASLLAAHKGENVVVLDMRPLHTWTDFFVIATAASSAHMAGLERRMREFARENALVIRNGSRRRTHDDGWYLLDMGEIVVHIMSAAARAFYELERLWEAGARIQ
jgi:ribosome-associated protein